MNSALFGRTLTGNTYPFLHDLIARLRNSGGGLTIYRPFYLSIREHLDLDFEPDLFTTGDELRGKADVLFSFGGDGTILDALTLIGDSGIPIAGVNLGRLGFLSGIPRELILPAIDAILAREYQVDERTLLSLETKTNLFPDFNFALNELTVYKSKAMSMLTIRTYVNGDFLNTYWADGLIVATPTGSTAYSLSCTGPILTPDAENFVITPIASHNLTVRPIVVRDDSVITIRVEGKEPEYFVSLDSRTEAAISSLELTVRRAPFKIRLLRLKDGSFFRTIREKLNWGLDIRN